MRLAVLMLTLLLGASSLAGAQSFDLGAEVDGYRRFLVYPHLQKGWESLQRGDRPRAIAEFERAREIAPESAVVAVHLAEAYAAAGDRTRAEALLRKQLTQTPDDQRVKDALQRLRAPSTPAMRAPAAVTGATKGSSPMTPVPPPAAVRRTPHAAPGPTRPIPVDRAPAIAASTPAASSAPVVDSRTLPRAGFDRALEEGRVADAGAHAAALLGTDDSPALLDELTFRLLSAGGHDDALALLAGGYPYHGGSLAERDRLLARLLLALEAHGGTAEATLSALMAALRVPLDAPALRARQSVLWASRGECSAVRALLGDLSDAYGHDEFVRLGDCVGAEDRARGREAYARAHAVRPGGAGTRALAYAAFADGDYTSAVAAWRSVPPAALTPADLEAATGAALAAGDRGQAAAWLSAWKESGGDAQYAFWAASARAAAGHDAGAEAEALREAVRLRPNTDDALRLARLQPAGGDRLRAFDAAVAIDPSRADAQRERGYAYQHANREADALAAFERAARLDPEHADTHLQVAYGHWRAGNADAAAGAFARAWAVRRDVAAVDGLVHAHTRLGHAREARWYAEQAIDLGSAAFRPDGTPAGGIPLATSDRVAADRERAAAGREFGLRRLHEDLGRRVTVLLDGFSGTRAGTGASLVRDGRIHSSYSQVELDVRLGSNPVRAGRTLSAYARVMADGGVDSMLPSRHPLLGAGVRWKPFRSQVVYLAGEYQTALDDRDARDLLLRASGSFLNGGRFSDDWHPSGGGWFSQNLYLDAAHYVDAALTAATADYRASHHTKITRASTLEPYAHVQVNGLRAARVEDDTRVGAGLRWNLWYGASRYDAPAHKLSVGVEFQQAIETYLPERRGLFVTLGARW